MEEEEEEADKGHLRVAAWLHGLTFNGCSTGIAFETQESRSSTESCEEMSPFWGLSRGNVRHV